MLIQSNEDVRVKFKACIVELCQWMANNWLMFNDEKTEFMILISRFSDPVTFLIFHNVFRLVT